MKNQHDYADAEVKGLERYIPNSSSKTILIAIPSLGATAFFVTPSILSTLGIEWSKNEVGIASIAFAFFTAFIV